MAFGFNPFTGNFDLTGGGDAAPFAGQVDAYADLPLDSAAALNSRWLVKNNSGTWPFSTYKQAGIYIRVSTVGASRDTDYQFVGTLPSVMNDSEFLVYDDTDATKNLKFNVGANVPTASTVTLTAPSASGTIGFLQSVSSITVSTDHQLTAARNQRVLVNSTGGGSGTAVYLPATGNAEGDRLEVACVGLTSGTLNVRTGQYNFTVSVAMVLGEQRTFIYASGAWTVGTVESHTHSGLGPTFASSAFRVTEPSGLVTNQLAFSLSGITAGATRTLTVPDASGRIQIEGQPIGNTTPAAGTFTTLDTADGSRTALPFRFTGETNNGFYRRAANTLTFVTGGSNRFEISGSAVRLEVNQSFNWVSNDLTGSPDLTLVRDAADTLAQRRAANPQTFNIYNTFTSSTNHERGFLRWSSNTFTIGTEKGSGGGTARGLALQVDGADRLTINTNTTTGVGIASNLSISSSFGIGLRSGNFATATTRIHSDASDTIDLRRDGNGQQIRIYNTYASSTDFERARLRWASDEFILDAEKGGTGTLRGIKIGSATSSLLGFYGVTPVDQPATVADPAGGGTVDTEARTAINAIIDRLQELGLIA
jgi:hypothetical protein